MTSNRSTTARRWHRIAIFLIATAACLTVAAITLIYILSTASDVPLYDEWRNVPYAAKIAEGRWSISDLFRVDQGHLAVMLHVGTLLSTLLFQYDPRLSNALGFAFLLIAVLVIAFTLRNRAVSRPLLFGVAMLAISTAVFTIQGWENLAMPWLIDPAASLMFMVAAVALIDRESRAAYAAGYICAFMCWLSFSNGIVLFFAASLQLCLAGKRQRALWVAIGGGLVTIATVWFWLDRNPEDRGPGSGVLDAVATIQRFLALLGSPFTFSHRVVSADGPVSSSDQILATVVGGMIFVSLGAYIFFNRKRIPEARFSIALLLFGFGSCGLIALGRSDLPVAQAMSSRYVTVALIPFIGMIAFMLVTADRVASRIALTSLCVLMVASFTFAAQSEFGIARFRKEGSERWREVVLNYKTATDEQLKNPHFDPAWIRAWAGQLDKNRLGPFRDRRSEPRVE